MNNKKHAGELHQEHTTWNNKMAFYKDELRIMNSRLAEIAVKYTSRDVLRLVEHFQNQFITQNQNVDTLKHKINEHEAFIQRDMVLNPVASDHKLYADSPQLRDEIESFEKVFNGLRHEYIQFLAKHM
ncbi:MAG: hypothetical protein ACHQF2_01560 [Flavobacteriales bacterium]